MNKREFTFFENSKILKNTVFEDYSILRIEHVVIKNRKVWGKECIFQKKVDIPKTKVDISKKCIFLKMDIFKSGYLKKWIF